MLADASCTQCRGLANPRVELNAICVRLYLDLLDREILVHVGDSFDRFHQSLA